MKTIEEQRAYQNEWAKKNRAKRTATHAAWATKNREKLNAYQREYQREYRRKNPGKVKAYQEKHYRTRGVERRTLNRAAYLDGKWEVHLKRKYGVDAARYAEMLGQQGGCCAICKTNVPGGRSARFHVDHCHATGRVRGLLCNSCNHLLGNARDSLDTLRAAIAYLSNGTLLATGVSSV